LSPDNLILGTGGVVTGSSNSKAGGGGDSPRFQQETAALSQS